MHGKHDSVSFSFIAAAPMKNALFAVILMVEFL
jgi:hypothetical protein